MLRRLKVSKEKEIPLIIYFSFLSTYLIIRIFIYALPSIFLNVKGVHVHHFAYGILVITFVGLYDLIVRPVGKSLKIVAVLFGVGMAFAYDEFGMWLRLRDYDVARFGYDAIVIISLFMLSVIYFERFWWWLVKPAVSKFLKKF